MELFKKICPQFLLTTAFQQSQMEELVGGKRVEVVRTELDSDFSSSERSLLMNWIHNHHQEFEQELNMVCVEESTENCNCTKLMEDNQNLVKLIQRALTTKTWDCKNLKFHTITPKDIFGENFKIAKDEPQERDNNLMTLEEVNESFMEVSRILLELAKRNKELEYQKVAQNSYFHIEFNSIFSSLNASFSQENSVYSLMMEKSKF